MTKATEKQEFFESNKGGLPKTQSNTNLFQLFEGININSYHALEKSLQWNKSESVSFVEEVERIRMYLGLGNSIFFHGYGSKRTFLRQLALKFRQIPQMEVLGYDDSIKLRSVLVSLITLVMRLVGEDERKTVGFGKLFKKDDGKLMVMLQEKLKKFMEMNLSLLLVIHTIDGSKLRHPETQMMLSQIASTKGIHLICSVEHHKWLLDCGYECLKNFSPIFIELNTLELYKEEVTETVDLTGAKEERQAKSLQFILKSFGKLQK